MKWKILRNLIPDEVTITNKVKYRVYWSSDLKKNCGETDLEKKQIVIQLGLSDKLTVITYLHEIAHAISFEHGVALTEQQILQLESSFYYLLKPNNVFKK